MVVASGTKIADEIGISRSEVWRLIQQLRGLGVDVAGHPATGYQLRAVPDLLLPEILAPLVKGTISRKIFIIITRSDRPTQRQCARRVRGLPRAACSWRRTACRAREGAHKWHSARSAGIYCSAVFRPAMPPSEALIFSLAAGLAVHAAVVETFPGLRCDLKWPNDLLLNGKKFCGILTEMNSEATRVRHLVVGVGINVNQTKFPAELREIATSLKSETGTEWSRVELCAALLKSLDREYRCLLEDADARDAILWRFQEHSSSTCGGRVRVEENGGIEGITEGLDTRGFLRVRTAAGLRTVFSGTVVIQE